MKSRIIIVFLAILNTNSIDCTYYRKPSQLQSYFTSYPMLDRIDTAAAFVKSDLPLFVEDICSFNATLANKFKDFRHFEGVENWLDNLLCIAQHESSFNYRAIGNKNQDPGRPDCYQSQDFGIWQFSECYWCESKPKWARRSACGRKCTDYLDPNLLDEIVECFKEIFSEEKQDGSINGFTPWWAWQQSCDCGAGKKLVCPKSCDRETFYCHKSLHCVDI